MSTFCTRDTSLQTSPPVSDITDDLFGFLNEFPQFTDSFHAESDTLRTPDAFADLFAMSPRTPPSEAELHPLLRPPSPDNLFAFSDPLQQDAFLDFLLLAQPETISPLFFAPSPPAPVARTTPLPVFVQQQDIQPEMPLTPPACLRESFKKYEPTFTPANSPATLPSPMPLTESWYPPSPKPCSNNSATAASSKPESNNNKLRRHTLTKPQRDYMISIYNNNNVPESKLLKTVAEKVGISFRHCQFWFQNRRAYARKRERMEKDGRC
ncbi:hypothetical protein HDU98_007359 [Podochytrium sp. JEL0797]|nr:hypothetical protein HDU98_007359 [Podochytrium sp. JEL0797]